MCNVNEVRCVQTQTAEPVASKPTVIELEIATEIVTRYKSPGCDQVTAELSQSRGKQYILRFSNLLIVATWNKDEFPPLFQADFLHYSRQISSIIPGRFPPLFQADFLHYTRQISSIIPGRSPPLFQADFLHYSRQTHAISDYVC